MDQTPNSTNAGRFLVIANHLQTLLFVVFCLSLLGGCRICPDCEDLDYPAYGGAWQRTLRDSGRVGSFFDPGGARTSELASRDSPITSSELERQSQESSGEEEESDDIESLEAEDSDSSDASDDEPDDLDLEESELDNRKLEDIELEREKELKGKSLDDIEVSIIPSQPVPPSLR